MIVEDVIHKTANIALNKGIDWRYDFNTIKEQMLWAPYILPKILTSEKHLYLACFSVTYLFYVEDAKVRYKDFVHHAMDIHSRRATAPTDEYDRNKYDIVYYYEKLLQETLSPFNYELVHKDLLDFLPTEFDGNQEKHFSSMDDYLNERLKNIAVHIFFIMLYDALNLNFPTEHDHYFRKAVFNILIFNDLHSYIKEKAENEQYNALVLLQKEKNDIEHNVQELLQMANDYLLASYEIKDELTREVLVAAQLGNIAWGSTCRRYGVMKNLKWQ